jgi:3',5'-cyclic AMP phosphodiesterase CpdA
MIGDWGTHMTDNVAMLRQGLKELSPDAVIHLGDVYYSGTPQECKENVIDVLDALVAELKIERPPFFSLPGNHDYYSGGRGFYQMIGQINAAAPGCEQKASYFCLRTADERWQFLGMDTGFNDRDPIDHKSPALVDNEVEWHSDKLKNFSGTTVLLSHHQLFSANEVLNDGKRPYLNEDLHKVFQPFYDRVAAWFWGHEHCLIFFKDNQLFDGDTKALKKGRLVGCSAYEESVDDDPYRVNDACKDIAFMDKRLDRSLYKSSTQELYNHAFALLEISPQNIKVSYYQYPSWDQDFAPMHPPLTPPLYVEELPFIPRP